MPVYHFSFSEFTSECSLGIGYSEMSITFETYDSYQPGNPHKHRYHIRFESKKKRCYIWWQGKYHRPQHAHTVIQEYIQYYYLNGSYSHSRNWDCNWTVLYSLRKHLNFRRTIIIRNMIQKFIYHRIESTVDVFSKHHNKTDKQYQKRYIPNISDPGFSRLKKPAEKERQQYVRN